MDQISNSSLVPPEDALRRRARWRSCIWPGCGYAVLGQRRLALLGSVLTLVWFVSIIWFGLAFRPLEFWVVVALAALFLVFWLVEYLAVGKMPVRQEDHILVRLFVPLACVGYALLMGALLVFFTFVGVTRVAGSGMQPALLRDEWILYRKEPVQIIPAGQVIMFTPSRESSWEPGGSPVVARVLAGPGDRLSRQDNRYSLNGRLTAAVGPVDPLEQVLFIPEAPASLQVPDGCFFVVPDASKAFDSQVFSWVRPGDVISTRIMRFGSRGWAKVVQ